MDPGYPEAHDFLGLTYEQKGMYEQAIAEFQKAINVSGNSSHIRAELGHAYAVAGKSREALEILDNLKGLSTESKCPRQRRCSGTQDHKA